MTTYDWPAQAHTTLPMPHDTVLHLVKCHGWEPKAYPKAEAVQAHRYAHGLDGRPDLADPRLGHNHPVGPAPSSPWSNPLTWIVLIWNTLMLAWLGYAVIATSKGVADCSVETYSDACAAGATVGGGIAIVGILLVAALVDVILGVIWMVTRKERA